VNLLCPTSCPNSQEMRVTGTLELPGIQHLGPLSGLTGSRCSYGFSCLKSIASGSPLSGDTGQIVFVT
jgi:hypothetical protein